MRKLVAAGALAALTLGTAACGIESSEINEVGLVYSGGITQDKAFEGILPPGSTNNQVGLGSTVYRYRTDQRSFIAAPEGKPRDVAPVEVVSEDDVRMLVEYQLYFTVNQEEAVLREFHENLGVKTEAWTPEGWTQLLNEYFAPQVERALEAAALRHPWRDLFASEAARVTFQQETVAALKRNIQEVIGGDYFCGPSYQGPGDPCGDLTFTVGKPYPVNAAIVEAVEAEQVAAAETIAQEQANQRVRAELEAERELVELYGPEGALLREAIRSGKVQFMVVPPGTPVSAPRPETGS